MELPPGAMGGQTFARTIFVEGGRSFQLDTVGHEDIDKIVFVRYGLGKDGQMLRWARGRPVEERRS